MECQRRAQDILKRFKEHEKRQSANFLVSIVCDLEKLKNDIPETEIDEANKHTLQELLNEISTAVEKGKNKHEEILSKVDKCLLKIYKLPVTKREERTKGRVSVDSGIVTSKDCTNSNESGDADDNKLDSTVQTSETTKGNNQTSREGEYPSNQSLKLPVQESRSEDNHEPDSNASTIESAASAVYNRDSGVGDRDRVSSDNPVSVAKQNTSIADNVRQNPESTELSGLRAEASAQAPESVNKEEPWRTSMELTKYMNLGPSEKEMISKQDQVKLNRKQAKPRQESAATDE